MSLAQGTCCLLWTFDAAVDCSLVYPAMYSVLFINASWYNTGTLRRRRGAQQRRRNEPAEEPRTLQPRPSFEMLLVL